MITVDANNAAEVYAAGTRLLYDELGPDVARAFLNLPFGGTGDYTAEKKLQPEWTDEDYEKMMALVIEDAKVRGEA
jgi:hypothetical protein